MYALIVVVVVIIHDKVLKLYTRLCKVVNFSEKLHMFLVFVFKDISINGKIQKESMIARYFCF